MYFNDQTYHVIRKISSSSGVITTIAGHVVGGVGIADNTGDGYSAANSNINTPLGVYYDTITDYFSFYASLQPQFYTFKENEFITLQSFMHFLKLFGIAATKDEINLYFQQLNTLIIPPVDNTLNIKNGLNFAQFLESILRITDIKAKSNDQPDHEENYRLMLQQIFQDATMAIKRKSEEDELIVQLYTPESQQLFYDKYGLLGAIFQNQSMTNNSIHLGLQFNEFAHILAQAGRLDA